MTANESGDQRRMATFSELADRAAVGPLELNLRPAV